MRRRFDWLVEPEVHPVERGLLSIVPYHGETSEERCAASSEHVSCANLAEAESTLLSCEDSMERKSSSLSLAA